MTWIDDYRVWLTEEQSLQNGQKVANVLISQGWTKNAIAAALGNMRHESSINPNMYEYNYDWAEDRGFGLVQWTPRSKLSNWTASQGLDFRDGDAQMLRLQYEAEQNIQWISTPNYPETFAEFRSSTKGLDYLTRAFTWNYERPRLDAGESSMPDRIAFAQRAFNELDYSGGGVVPGLPGGVQLAQFPADTIRVTQGEYGSFSHYEGSSQELAIDFGFPTVQWPLYAPFDAEVIQVLDEYAQVNWRSTVKVMGADGTLHDDLVFIIVHDDNWHRWSVGDTIKKGEHIGNSGNSGYSEGDHLHLQVIKGREHPWPTPVSAQLHIYDVFAVNGVNIVDGGGYNWRTSDYEDGEGGGGTDPTPRRGQGAISPADNAGKKYKYATEGTWQGMTYYTVRPGDTLGEIAQRHGVHINSIQRVRYSNIPNKNLIDAGETLILPGKAKAAPAAARTHTVRQGENLSYIAGRYGTTWQALAKKNGISNPDKIYPGQVLKI